MPRNREAMSAAMMLVAWTRPTPGGPPFDITPVPPVQPMNDVPVVASYVTVCTPSLVVTRMTPPWSAKPSVEATLMMGCGRDTPSEGAEMVVRVAVLGIALGGESGATLPGVPPAPRGWLR